MCGRFTLYTPIEQILERFSLPRFNFDYTPNYNVAPTQRVLTVISDQNKPKAALMRWGLTPSWRPQGQARPLINARLETVEEKPSFRALVNFRRCLIVADGFYEWQDGPEGKHPVYISLNGGKPFALAGLWNNPENPSCVIITQGAPPQLDPIHQRMPVILTPDTEKSWLGPEPFIKIKDSLPDQSRRSFTHYRVSALVNSPKNNSRTCIEPVQ